MHIVEKGNIDFIRIMDKTADVLWFEKQDLSRYETPTPMLSMRKRFEGTRPCSANKIEIVRRILGHRHGEFPFESVSILQLFVPLKLPLNRTQSSANALELHIKY